MIGPKLQKLKETEDIQEIQRIISEIKADAESLNYPTPEFREKMIAMLMDSIDMFVRERYQNQYNEQNCRILDTFSILDTLK